MRAVNFTADNHIDLLQSGAEFFPALIAAINGARDEVYLETYIFAADATAQRVKAALMEAAKRGVAVRVVTDWLGTGRAHNTLLTEEFLGTPIKHRIFNPWFRRGVVRTHRKLCVVDHQIAFVGGININDDMFTDDARHLPLPAPRWDFSIRIVGPLVPTIHAELEAQWMRMGGIKLRARWDEFKRARVKINMASHGAASAGLVIRDNLRNRRTIQRAYMQALGHARESALLANPYFAPGRKLRQALVSAAQRGVKVTLLLGVGHYRLQDAVTHSYYPKLLKAGVRIVEYRKTALHAKVAVVDDEWATVGSSNYDGLSLLVNQEANVVIRDAKFADLLRQKIEAGIADGVEVQSAEFGHRSWSRRLWYGSAFFVYRFAMRIMTIGNNH
ncbi:cardiolipin synthase ClsB [Glaciimonas sp. CA11.2]|uniref:cardiolipin synthase ClsB n=1 Tax=unclassified Glaciimonas TaxID=2644401 RepID=UPI002AB4DBB0|nr:MULTISPECIES: cardiolipin synthase ClsB [unclassified Glaciimonas]MDY7545516.1 cardiolipin synthase ClsB [Glaciimonas sp. CA11.2]MEB0012797.1 cardiolipin synthase ClsB [Glaciimonas sp. Cout2]MEB0082275.1 cardiolipin synthase ClsB [Glaciimonas sp. Gout2]MEB0162657.1 cardiolipin synthase ClsB [Glaciimonas sp. CA11.2]